MGKTRAGLQIRFDVAYSNCHCTPGAKFCKPLLTKPVSMQEEDWQDYPAYALVMGPK